MTATDDLEFETVGDDEPGDDDTADLFDDPEEVNPWAGPVRIYRGRYSLPHPDTGKPTLFTRVSKIKEVIPDFYNLHQWKDRNLAKGLAMREELVELAAATPVDGAEHRGIWNDLIAKARDTAGGNKGSLHGTAFHSMTEYVDRGEELPEGVRSELAGQIARYQFALEVIGTRMDHRWIERVVWHREHKLAGRLDRVMEIDMDALVELNPEIAEWITRPGGRQWVIGDVKSQKTMEYSNVGMAVQFAVYAAAEKVWDETEGRWEDIDVDINPDIAIVMHTPSIDPRADLQVVNLHDGKELLDLSMTVRKARNRKVNRPLVSVDETRWYASIKNASSRQHLSEVFEYANKRGEWNKALEIVGKRRLRELEGN